MINTTAEYSKYDAYVYTPILTPWACYITTNFCNKKWFSSLNSANNRPRLSQILDIDDMAQSYKCEMKNVDVDVEYTVVQSYHASLITLKVTAFTIQKKALGL